MNWLERRLETDEEMGFPAKIYKKAGKRYYLVSIAEDEVVLIQDRGPLKHDYSISMYVNPDKREVINQKTRNEYRESAKDKKWKFSRAIIASDSIDNLPNIEEFLEIGKSEVIETKEEIFKQKEIINKELNQIQNTSESDSIIEEYLEEQKERVKIVESTPDEDEFIIIPGEFKIKPKTNKKESIQPIVSLINEDEENLEIDNEIEDVEDITKIPEDLLEEEKMVTEQLEENKRMEEAMISTPSTFRTFETMYEELAENAFNPKGVLNKDPQTNKYLELEWMSRHFRSKGETGKSAKLIEIYENLS